MYLEGRQCHSDDNYSRQFHNLVKSSHIIYPARLSLSSTPVHLVKPRLSSATPYEVSIIDREVHNSKIFPRARTIALLRRRNFQFLLAVLCIFPCDPPISLTTSDSCIIGVTISTLDWNRGIIFKHVPHIEGEFPYLESQRAQKWR